MCHCSVSSTANEGNNCESICIGLFSLSETCIHSNFQREVNRNYSHCKINLCFYRMIFRDIFLDWNIHLWQIVQRSFRNVCMFVFSLLTQVEGITLNIKHMQKSYTIEKHKKNNNRIIEVNLKFNLYTYVAVWTFIIKCVKCIRNKHWDYWWELSICRKTKRLFWRGVVKSDHLRNSCFSKSSHPL